MTVKYYEIKYNKCEVCGEFSHFAMNDDDMNLHYACMIHSLDLWNKLNRERRKENNNNSNNNNS